MDYRILEGRRSKSIWTLIVLGAGTFLFYEIIISTIGCKVGIECQGVTKQFVLNIFGSLGMSLFSVGVGGLAISGVRLLFSLKQSEIGPVRKEIISHLFSVATLVVGLLMTTTFLMLMLQ